MNLSICIKVKTDRKKNGIASYLIINNSALFNWLECFTLPYNQAYIKNRHKYIITKNHLMELKLKLHQLTLDNRDKFFPHSSSFQTPNNNNSMEDIENLKKTIDEILTIHDKKTEINYLCFW